MVAANGLGDFAGTAAAGGGAIGFAGGTMGPV